MELEDRAVGRAHREQDDLAVRRDRQRHRRGIQRPAPRDDLCCEHPRVVDREAQREQTDVRYDRVFGEVASLDPPGIFGPFGLFNGGNVQSGHTQAETPSVFGGVYFDVIRDLTVSLEGRYQSDKISVHYARNATAFVDAESTYQSVAPRLSDRGPSRPPSRRSPVAEWFLLHSKDADTARAVRIRSPRTSVDMQTAIDPVPSPSQNASTEARLARLETHIEHINANLADLRVGSNRLETQVDQGFARLDAKMDAGFARLDADMDDGFARLDADIDGFARLDDKTAGLDGKMDSGFARLDGKIAGLDDKMDGGFARLDAKIDRNFLILGGMVVSLGVGMAGMMAKGFQWL